MGAEVAMPPGLALSGVVELEHEPEHAQGVEVDHSDLLTSLQSMLDAREAAVRADTKAQMALDLIGASSSPEGQERGLLARQTKTDKRNDTLEAAIVRIEQGHRVQVYAALAIVVWVLAQLYVLYVDRWAPTAPERSDSAERAR